MDLYTFCEYTHGFVHIPIYIYKNNELSAQIQIFSHTLAPVEMISRQMMEKHDPISIFETSIGSYYGQIFIDSQNISVILGPVSPLSYTNDSIRKFQFSYHIPSSEDDAYLHTLPLIPNMSLMAFISLLCQMSYVITDIKPDFPMDVVRPYQLDSLPITAEFTAHRATNLETGYHNTLYETINISMPMIRNGDLEGLVRYSRNLIPINYGKYSNDLREQQLTVLIISLSNAATAAIQGGLDHQTALSLLEFYIGKAFKIDSPTDIETLSINAILDFTQRVKNEKYETYSSAQSTIYNCIQYIRERVYTPITVQEIAYYSGYSLEYFSMIFKRETGFNASTFIINCKLYESKKLLKFTNRKIGEISSQLCFSSQSHFQKAFKKKFHMTPLQYRNSNVSLDNSSSDF